METGGSVETAEGHVRSIFFSGKGVAATVIRQALQEQGGVGGGCTDREG